MWFGSPWRRLSRLSVLLLCGYFFIWMLFLSGDRISCRKTTGFLNSIFCELRAYTYNGHQISILRSRSRHLRHACQHLNTRRWPRTPARETMIFSREHQLLYCPIEKIGSSTWKRIFKVLNNNNNNNSSNKSVLSMPSMSAHGGLKDHVLRRDMGEERDRILATYTSFLFVRDPFSRLLSGYLDKILLPNPIGEALSNIRIAPFLEGVETGSLRGCYVDISFAEFCGYLVHAIHNREYIDRHFTPISDHCDPCNIKYEFLGKMETLVNDTRAILGVAGLDFDQITGKKEDFDTENELSIMHDVIKRTFMFIERYQTFCYSKLDALKRIWLDFQIRGYIPISSQFPYNYLHNKEQEISDSEWRAVILKDFEMRVRKAYSIPRSKEQRRQDKAEVTARVFRAVPMETLQQLASVFETDCYLFGYSCNVTERFFNT